MNKHGTKLLHRESYILFEKIAAILASTALTVKTGPARAYDS